MTVSQTKSTYAASLTGLFVAVTLSAAAALSVTAAKAAEDVTGGA